MLNGEDPLSSHLAADNKRVYFGIEDRSIYMGERDNIIQDMTACPECGTKLKYEYIRYNHIGKAKCPNCDFASPEEFDYAVEKIDTENRRLYLRTPKGKYDIKLLGDNITDVYNQITAVAVLMEFKVSIKRITESFEKMEIAKSRYEELVINGKHIIANVAKGQNPVACSRVCDFIRKEEGDKAVILTIDDYFDRKETSENIAWFFDTDFEFLNEDSVKQVIVGGRRYNDLKLRLLMAGIPEEKISCIEEDTKTAELVDLTKSDKVYILYDVFTTDHFAKPVQKRLGERAERGAFTVSAEYKKYLHPDFEKFQSAEADATAAEGSVAKVEAKTVDASAGKGKVIEVLFPEFCNLFGDSSNVKYLKACLPGAEFKYTAFTEEPYFVNNKPDLIYLGAMTERKQEMVAGKLMRYKERLAELRDEGAAISPFNAFLLLQGVETLSLRLERHAENTKKVVEFLSSHPQVEKVNHPSLPDHPDHALYQKYFPNGGASIFTFDVKGGREEAWKFIDGLKIFSLLANVADVKSLVIHPASTTHSQLSDAELADQGIHQNTIRLSIGTEHIDDIIADLEAGFAAI